jgi:hypothetical protein
MRKVAGLVLFGAAVLGPISIAQATEVTRLPANNIFATASSNDPNTGASSFLFVSREKTNKGGPIDHIFFFSVDPNGNFFEGMGVLPQGAFHWDAKSSSLNVNVDDIAYDFEFGVPAGVISVDWTVTDVERTSGSTKIDAGAGMHVQIVGTRTGAPATVTGSVVGDALTNATGELDRIVQAVIIVTKD